MAAIVEGSTQQRKQEHSVSRYQSEGQLQLISVLLSDLPDFADLSHALYAKCPCDFTSINLSTGKSFKESHEKGGNISLFFMFNQLFLMFLMMWAESWNKHMGLPLMQIHRPSLLSMTYFNRSFGYNHETYHSFAQIASFICTNWFTSNKLFTFLKINFII